jgi:ssDNA-binding Zn-finger/Zn-ribbon topoisomerase 1
VIEILYTTATDKNGNLVHIDYAQKGKSYYCPMCKKEFIVRKSGKIGKGSKRPHFAHNELTPNCSPEGVLHYSFKKMLLSLLERNKAVNVPFRFNWICDDCFDKNSGNLLEKVSSIKEEYALETCRPDIALVDNEENVFAVIEIVVTHKPEDIILQYYKKKKIILIQITLTSDEDLKMVEEKITHPDFVDFCLNPKCQHSDSNKISRKVKVHVDRCGICFNQIEKYYISIDSVFGRKESIDFTENEISLVKSKRQNIVIKTNEPIKEKYPVFDCLNCKRNRSRYNSFRL